MQEAEENSPNEELSIDTTDSSTSVEAISLPKAWSIYEGEFNGFFRPLFFELPNGFKIRTDGTHSCIKNLSALAMRDIFFSTDDGSRYFIENDGILILQDTDVWINPNFSFGDVVTHASKLAWAYSSYLLSKVEDERVYRP